jgi:uncharacterized protein YjiS (DUF1127 family)
MFESISITNQHEDTKRLASTVRIMSAPWKGIMRHFVRRAGAARLREFDDEALRDIGLAPSEIRAAAHGLMTAADEKTYRDYRFGRR